jgi:hypothetical protein
VRITSAIGSASCSPSASSGNRIWKCRRWTSTGRAPRRGVVVGQLGGVRGEARPGSAGRKAVAELRARRRGGRQAERDHDRVLLGVEVSLDRARRRQRIVVGDRERRAVGQHAGRGGDAHATVAERVGVDREPRVAPVEPLRHA